MKYRYSHLDEQNIDWFLNDNSRSSLMQIALRRGEVRGLSPFQIQFNYPISVIAGKNGSGKSTILALAACAYHNKKSGFRLPRRQTSYYTMSDFFIQSSEELAVDGINIWYQFLFDNWRPTSTLPDGIGLAWQSRTKKKGGKWSHYSRRVNRNVAFFGIERVVPHSERSVSKSYRRSFTKSELAGYENEVLPIVSRILGKHYNDFWFREHSKYRLPHVKCKSNIYSGFNMGAGENALFEILSTILSAPEGLLIVIDEIELGLHDSAQSKFINELKKLCKSRKIQVICTTHSPTIIGALPPEGRFYLENSRDKTIILNGISPLYAAGKLADQNSKELDVLIEDGVACQLFQSSLSTELRRRINIIPIGSSSAIIRQLSARYLDKGSKPCVAVLDGDQRARKSYLIKYFNKNLESKSGEVSTEWIQQRLFFLPGDTWPEWWIFSTLQDYEVNDLANSFGISEVEFEDLCEQAIDSGKHSEFPTLAHHLSLPVDEVCCTVSNWIASVELDKFKETHEAIHSLID